MRHLRVDNRDENPSRVALFLTCGIRVAQAILGILDLGFVDLNLIKAVYLALDGCVLFFTLLTYQCHSFFWVADRRRGFREKIGSTRCYFFQLRIPGGKL